MWWPVLICIRDGMDSTGDSVGKFNRLTQYDVTTLSNRVERKFPTCRSVAIAMPHICAKIIVQSDDVTSRREQKDCASSSTIQRLKSS